MMNKSKVLTNAKWMIICKTIQSLLQLVIGMLMARYLGPSDYGLINYAKSIVAFAMPFVQLGLDSTLIKELIDKPEEEGKIIGTALITGTVSGLVWSIIIGGVVYTLNYTETQTIIVCVLYSFSCVFQSITLIQFWYHSKLQIKTLAIVQLSCYFFVALFKIVLLIVKASVNWFALAYSVEYCIVGFALLFVFRKHSEEKLLFSYEFCIQLLKRSYPYIMASFMVSTFQNIDHIMLKEMLGNQENGYYTAAITVVGICQYVYIAVIDAARPVIIEHRMHNTNEYRNGLANLYGIITFLSLLQGICFTLFSKCIVQILYGIDFLEAVPVVKVLVWGMPFSCMGLIRNIWILSENKQKCLWKINFTGVIVNVFANMLMIPRWGAMGAAFASLLTQFLMNFCLGFIYGEIRDNNKIIMMGINPVYLLSSLRSNGIRFKKNR